MKMKWIMLASFGVLSANALEAPQKVEPLAPNAAPQVEAQADAVVEIVPAAGEPQAEKKPVEQMPMVENQKAYIGLGLDAVPEVLANHLGLDAGTCALVRILDPNGPAAAAGLKENDIIIGVDGKAVKSHHCLSQMMDKQKPGTEVSIAYLHRGKEEKATVKLAARAAEAVADAEDENAPAPILPKDMLRGLPKEMRDAIEKNLKALEADGAIDAAGIQALPMQADMLPELQKRMEKMLDGMQQLQVDPAAPKVKMQMKSTLKMMDNEGNIEIQRDGESVEAKVFDKQGELLWSGPYFTPQDKAAVPPPIRERLDALNIDVNGNGIRIQRMPNR
jgi:serine protease Do